ncbi:unnamed protein product [Angiostrongylus costaricensis]|uniref:RGS domain-containing protein n=1 Tax=Angiostrongylus costaricensis TaxID=334426 RepID=A0A158PG58_ANGCS|nr:unnamed protein product [Angiostrongylus costaricensis]
MVSEVDERDEDLMNKYKCFGLNFTEPTLNSEGIQRFFIKVVKKLTCRSSITKALNQAIFYGIHYDNSSNVLMVGLNENARLYSEEELKKAAEACEATASSNAAKSVYGRPSNPNQSSVVEPRSSWHPENRTDEIPQEPLTADVRDQRHVPTLSSNLSVGTVESAAIDNSMGTRMFQREYNEDSMPVMVEPSARSSARKTDLSNHTFAQQKSAYRTPDHRSAFGVYRAASNSKEQESNWEKIYDARVQHAASTSQNSAKVSELYERGRNGGWQREFGRRSSSERYQEGQCSRHNYAAIVLSLCVFPSFVGTLANLISLMIMDQNATLRESTLSSEERVCLRMIRDFAYVYRNPAIHGFRTVENVVNLFPTNSIEYWVRLIQSHLQEVEIVTLDNMVW